MTNKQEPLRLHPWEALEYVHSSMGGVEALAIAMDKDSTWFITKQMPVREASYWNGAGVYIRDLNSLLAKEIKIIIPDNFDWTKSLWVISPDTGKAVRPEELEWEDVKKIVMVRDKDSEEFVPGEFVEERKGIYYIKGTGDSIPYDQARRLTKAEKAQYGILDLHKSREVNERDYGKPVRVWNVVEKTTSNPPGYQATITQRTVTLEFIQSDHDKYNRYKGNDGKWYDNAERLTPVDLNLARGGDSHDD
jgi:hypothetical protein